MTRKDLILECLKQFDPKPVPAPVLASVQVGGFRFSAYVMRLRRDGIPIYTFDVPGKPWKAYGLTDRAAQ